MNYKTIFKPRHELSYYKNLSKEIASKPKEIKQLVDVILLNEKDYSFWASWFLCHVFDHNKDAIIPHITPLFNLIKKVHTHGTARSILRCIALLPIEKTPLKIEEDLIHLSFSLLEDPKEEIAFKANAMMQIYNYRKKYPELMQEMKALIELIFEQGRDTPGIRVRARKYLNWP